MMEPSFAPKWEDTLKPTFEWTWQKSGSCPEGTVPIRRISRDDILRANSIESFGKKDVSGANGSVEPGEWSQSALIVGNTKGEAHSFIEAGWSIHPVVFGDTKTRVYAYWTDKKQSSWWLRILGDYVGYWPDSIFRGFTSCPIVNWGGAILNKRSGAELMDEFGEFHPPKPVEPYYSKESPKTPKCVKSCLK
ncbi:hypothetical protein QJS10_CPA06g00947 [Acorus calamus]|uniref:Neprosin domain-containing protein n=1 Tax=Acorus calamus TaxID=4465 RepID=A0AAV9EHK4_ACOCL|nr:hypothetical protein QJS10_CPA06g00947 [Acorus calamus]